MRRPSAPVCRSSPSPQHVPKVPPGLGRNPLPSRSGSGFLGAGIASRQRGAETSPSPEPAEPGRLKKKKKN